MVVLRELTPPSPTDCWDWLQLHRRQENDKAMDGIFNRIQFRIDFAEIPAGAVMSDPEVDNQCKKLRNVRIKNS